MIDTMGYGIHTMYVEQRKRFFPLPDYSNSTAKNVVLEIYGHAIDENYSRILMEKKDLPLSTVIMLDRVQKKLPITDDAFAFLKKEKLIEGRKPNIYVAAHIAEATGDKVAYIKNRAFDDEHYKNMIMAFIDKFGSATRKELDDLIMEKLSAVLSDKQKKIKMNNLISVLRKEGKIKNNGSFTKPKWVLSEG